MLTLIYESTHVCANEEGRREALVHSPRSVLGRSGNKKRFTRTPYSAMFLEAYSV